MDKSSIWIFHSVFMFIFCVAVRTYPNNRHDLIAMMAFVNNYFDTLILCVDGRYRIFIVAFDLGSHIQKHLITTGYIKTLRVYYGNSKIMHNRTFSFTQVIKTMR